VQVIFMVKVCLA